MENLCKGKAYFWITFKIYLDLAWQKFFVNCYDDENKIVKFGSK